MNNLKKILDSDKAYEILDGSLASGTMWTQGGCAILAFALNKTYGYPVYVIYDNDLKQADHFVVKLPNGNYLDYRGEHKDLITDFKEDEMLWDKDLDIRLYEKGMNISDIVIDDNASDELANLIKSSKHIKENNGNDIVFLRNTKYSNKGTEKHLPWDGIHAWAVRKSDLDKFFQQAFYQGAEKNNFIEIDPSGKKIYALDFKKAHDYVMGDSGVNLSLEKFDPNKHVLSFKKMTGKTMYPYHSDLNYQILINPSIKKDNNIKENTTIAGVKVYHRTKANIEGPMRTPAFFSTDIDYGRSLGPNIITATLDIKNPADLKSMHISPSDPDFPKIAKKLASKGYDGAYYGVAWIAFYPEQINIIEKNPSYDNTLKENTSNLWLNGGILLIKGKDFSDGTQPLYATHIVDLIQLNRKKKDETEGVPAKMAILSGDLFRVIIDNGKLRAAKVDWKNIGSLAKTLKFKGYQAHAVVLNNNKTPLHWETLKYNYFPKMFAEIGDEIMSIPNIKISLTENFIRGFVRSVIKEAFDETELSDEVYSGKFVNAHITNITPNEEDLPHFFMKEIAKRKFIIKEVNLLDLLKSDQDFANYYAGGKVEDRYDDEFDEVDPDDIYEPLVIVDGVLLDGYSRASSLLKRGEETTEAYVALPKKL